MEHSLDFGECFVTEFHFLAFTLVVLLKNNAVLDSQKFLCIYINLHLQSALWRRCAYVYWCTFVCFFLTFHSFRPGNHWSSGWKTWLPCYLLCWPNISVKKKQRPIPISCQQNILHQSHQSIHRTTSLMKKSVRTVGSTKIWMEFLGVFYYFLANEMSGLLFLAGEWSENALMHLPGRLIHLFLFFHAHT